MFRNPVLEIVKFLYAFLLGIVAVLLLSLALDILCWLVSGWTDVHGDPRAGAWPIVTGTVSRMLLTPFVYVFFLFTGIAGLVRTMMGSQTPVFLRFLEKDEPTPPTAGE